VMTSPVRLLVWVNTSSSKHTVKSAMSPVLVTVPVHVLQSAPSEQLAKKKRRTAAMSKIGLFMFLIWTYESNGLNRYP